MPDYEEPRMVTSYPYEPSNDNGCRIRAKALELAIAAMPGLAYKDIVECARAFEAFLRGN